MAQDPSADSWAPARSPRRHEILWQRREPIGKLQGRNPFRLAKIRFGTQTICQTGSGAGHSISPANSSEIRDTRTERGE